MEVADFVIGPKLRGFFFFFSSQFCQVGELAIHPPEE
jgi:hypothetical protein